MKTTHKIIAAALFAATGFASAQQMAGIGRTEVLRHDHAVAGTEAIQVRVDIPAGVTAPNHSHPGVEIAYVLEGTMEYTLEGRAPVILKTGDALYIPAGVNHAVRVIGDRNASELATYLVRKDQPLVKLAK
jgi:quercetin dioxygenase-like cupin family protein